MSKLLGGTSCLIPIFYVNVLWLSSLVWLSTLFTNINVLAKNVWTFLDNFGNNLFTKVY